MPIAIPMLLLATATAGLTIMSANAQARAQRRAADAAYAAQRRQAQLDADVKNIEIQQQQREAADTARKERQKKYRRRRLNATQYAASGVELSGTALDVQLRQVAADEADILQMHGISNEKSGLARWNMFEQYKQDVFSAESNRYAGRQQAKATKIAGYTQAVAGFATSYIGSSGFAKT